MTASHPHGSRGAPDRGFTLIELLIVIVVLGVLATVAVFAVLGISDRGEENACKADTKTLEIAIEAYFLKHLSSSLPSSPAPSGDEYEQTLVADGLLRTPSKYHNVDSDGAITTTGPPCP
jgi:prepilin-type N-terminal cleavage/methylation domain-containing protein